MGKIIAAIIIIALAIGAWYMLIQTSTTVTPTNETVNEPINQTRNLEKDATSPSRTTLSE